MSVGLIGVLGVLLLLLLIFARVPIAIALAASGLLGYAALDGWSPAVTARTVCGPTCAPARVPRAAA